MKRKITKTLLLGMSLVSSLPFMAKAQAPTPFVCSSLAYQVSGTGMGNSTLYSYNVVTGTQVSIGSLTSKMNAIGYSTFDNFIWGYDMNNDKVVKIGSNAVVASFTIPHLPNSLYNVGDVFGDGYLLLYKTGETKYYVVDIKLGRSTYLKLVNPTNGFLEETANYGTQFSGTAPFVSDLAYSPTNQRFYGIVSPGSPIVSQQFKVVTFNPIDRTTQYGSSAVTGGLIQSEVGQFGSVFTDAAANFLYVFSNQSGKFFKINRLANTAQHVSNSPPGQNNDGASCTDAFLTASVTGYVFHDKDGGNVNNSSGSINNVPAGLFANLVDNITGKVEAISTVNVAGAFGYNDISAGEYKVVLSITEGLIGQNPPAASLPSGWMNTGEFNGTPNTGNTAPIDGISAVFPLAAAVPVSNINFGIQQPPTADEKSFIVAGAAFSTTAPAGFPTLLNYRSISMSSASLIGYASGGSLSGSDPEDCISSSSCNIGTNSTFNIISIKSNTKLYYDFGGIIGIVEISTLPTEINNFDFNKFVLYGENGAGFTGNELGFSYSMTDEAGAKSTAKNYTIGTTVPLPISLIRFDADVINNVVQLKWITANEQNNKTFEVERSTNARTWNRIGFVNSKADAGNSTIQLAYDFADKNPVQGVNYYRLKQIDKDGKYAISQVESIVLSTLQNIEIRPNPTNGIITISGLKEGLHKITIVNSLGMELRTLTAKNKPSITIDLSKLASGIYYIHIMDKEGNKTNHKVIKN